MFFSGRRLTYLQQCVDLSPHMPDELFCGDVIDRLVLPPSSSDLLIQNEIIMPTLEVYKLDHNLESNEWFEVE